MQWCCGCRGISGALNNALCSGAVAVEGSVDYGIDPSIVSMIVASYPVLYGVVIEREQ